MLDKGTPPASVVLEGSLKRHWESGYSGAGQLSQWAFGRSAFEASDEP